MRTGGRWAAWALALAAAAFGAEPELVTTHHQIHAGGQTLSYTARAGLIPIRNNDTTRSTHGCSSRPILWMAPPLTGRDR